MSKVRSQHGSCRESRVRRERGRSAMRSLGANTILVIAITLMYSMSAVAQSVTIRAGTTVYGELDQSVTSKKRKTTVGEIVRAHVWRDVVIDGRVVIKAGAPVVVRVADVKSAKIAGIKGDLELEAVSVRGIGGSDVLVDGGYDKSGKGRKALSVTLFALVAWPLIFIKGKQATLDSGTVFDCTVQSDVTVAVDGSAPIRIRLADDSGLTVEVLYDQVDPEAKVKTLPVVLRSSEGTIESAAIVTVNEKGVKPLPLTLGNRKTVDNGEEVEGTIDLGKLAKVLSKGINRFEIEAAGARTEVVLDVEL